MAKSKVKMRLTIYGTDNTFKSVHELSGDDEMTVMATALSNLEPRTTVEDAKDALQEHGVDLVDYLLYCEQDLIYIFRRTS